MASGRQESPAGNTSMTTAQYAEKYGLSIRRVYRLLTAGNIQAVKRGGEWVLDDVAPSRPVTLFEQLDDYDIALLWLNATVSEDALLVRDVDPFVPMYLARKLHLHTWQRNGKTVLKISSKPLVRSLQGIGYTGRKDAELPPPPVDACAFAAAMTECRSSFVRQLRYPGKSRDKRRAYYSPCISLCASYPILEQYMSILYALGICPPRKLAPAPNVTSATIRITSHAQLAEIVARLSGHGHNDEFWDQMIVHINKPPEPYTLGRKADGNHD